MPTLFEHLAARLAAMHARRTFSRFSKALGGVDDVQNRVLQQSLSQLAGGDFARRHALHRVRNPADLKRAVPLQTYEDLRPYIDRVRDGETSALFGRGQSIVMFATSSGTTADPKYIPVTPRFVRDYRRGWNTFGLKMLSDHPAAVLRAILQSSGRCDESRTPSGIPCGAITGLMARTQKRIVRRFYVGAPEIANIADARARYYTLMRFAVVRDVAFAVTANPATLIQMARTADEQSETLIRDVRDGTLCAALVDDDPLRRRLEARLKPNPSRARELEAIRAQNGSLRPRHYWKLEFLACWTGASMGHYLQRLSDWYGDLPVRDIGLLASEGRVTIPLDDNTPVGVLDAPAACFEFIPVEHWDKPDAQTLTPRQIEPGRDYSVVLTNSAGLVRYRLDDVVRVRGWCDQAPLLEFLYRAGRVASLAGEKLTENQVVAAVREACRATGLAEFDFVAAPCWDDPPHYRLTCAVTPSAGLCEAIDGALAVQNDEYRSRRKSLRLGALRIRTVAPDCIRAMDARLMTTRSSRAEQYKRPCLFTRPGDDDEALKLDASVAKGSMSKPAAGGSE